MKLTREIIYAAPIETVRAMVFDPKFREASAHAMNVVSVDVDVTDVAGQISVVVDQVQRTDDVPAIAKKFIGETTRAIQKEVWDGDQAQFKIETPGAPTDIKGVLSLSEVAAGTCEKLDLDVKVKVPLIGSKLEGLLVEQLHKAIDVEEATGKAWLVNKS